jgi:hypothetical protein
MKHLHFKKDKNSIFSLSGRQIQIDGTETRDRGRLFSKTGAHSLGGKPFNK